MADLIHRNGGQAIVAPSMREIPLQENQEAVAFAERLKAGDIDAVIFLTGNGARTLFDVLKTLAPLDEWIALFSKTKLFCRGPKPLTVLREFGLSEIITVPEPNTWRELLQTIDGSGSLKGKTVAVQEYGAANRELLDGLQERGAVVVRVPVYRWALPENIEPLKQAIKTIVDGKADVMLFTNAQQINNVLQIAQREGMEKEFREAASRMVVASVGPVCSQFLDEYGLPVDVEPEHPKMGNLVLEASRRGAEVLEKKRQTIISPSIRPASAASLADSPFLKACRREPTAFTPVWLMRQAGRYMKEYRDLRERHSFLDLCKDSDLACEVSVYAAERLGVDAAIIFSDILLILEPMGLSLEYAKGEGPVIHNPVRDVSDVENLRALDDAQRLGFVYDAIRKTRRQLPAGLPLIGFAGAPFTLASYMIEGQGSRHFIQTKAFMYQRPEAWAALMTKISDSLVRYLNAQITAGAQAIQLFDSWIGCLSPDDYRRYVLPYSQNVIRGVAAGTPVIHFGTQTSALLEAMRDAGGDVIGVDWRVDLDSAWQRMPGAAIQGNLDPAVLFAEPAEIRRQARRILDQAAGRPGHIFNLGHGVLPNTPVGHVKALVDAVHELSATGRRT